MKPLTQLNGSLNRRNFLRTTGLAGLGLAGATALGAEFGGTTKIPGVTSMDIAATEVKAASGMDLTPNDIAVLQFALNLEYLEAEFYSYAVTGKSLYDNGIPTYGPVGTPGPTTGGTQVRFEASAASSGPLRQIAVQLMRNEVEHVLLLRSFLGDYTITKPTIRLDAMGSFASVKMFLTLARDFEITGVSAYGGAVTLLSPTVLQYAAQIALVEALHSGNIQLLCDLNKVSIKPLDWMDVVPPPTGVNFFDNSFDQALAVIRTPSQVLSIVYGDSNPGSRAGGFFPSGVNGAITTV